MTSNYIFTIITLNLKIKISTYSYSIILCINLFIQRKILEFKQPNIKNSGQNKNV